MEPIFNVSRRKVGGIWFLRVGRLQFMFCVCKPVAHSRRLERDIATLVKRTYPGGRKVVVNVEC